MGKTPIERELYQGKYLNVWYSREDGQISLAFPNQIHEKEWEALKKELEAVVKLQIK
jgi:hypothetical protein